MNRRNLLFTLLISLAGFFPRKVEAEKKAEISTNPKSKRFYKYKPGEACWHMHQKDLSTGKAVEAFKKMQSHILSRAYQR